MDTHQNARLTPKGRELMVRTVLDQGLSKAATARKFNTSAKTVAKWVNRFLAHGLDGLLDRSSRPLSLPSKTPLSTCDAIEVMRRQRHTQAHIAAAFGISPASVRVFTIAVAALSLVFTYLFARRLFRSAAVAAPGVDILVPAPDAGYQLTTGTSVAAAEVSGVVALLIERNPRLTPKDVRRILMRTARRLGPRGSEREYGAGLVNALGAVTAAAKGPGT